MATAAYDYTREDHVPFDENPDDFLIGNVTAGDKSAEEIEKENSFSTVPPGDHLLVVSGFRDAPQKGYFKVNVNGQFVGFEAYSVKVRFALPNDPKCTIDDFFLLPPEGRDALNAYYNGVPEGKKQAGWAATKFVHFINRLGYPFPPGAPLPESARRLGNWKGRAIHALVEAGKGSYKDKDGNDRPRGPQIKPFSYRVSEATLGGHGPQGSTGPQGHPSQPYSPQSHQPQGSQSSQSGYLTGYGNRSGTGPYAGRPAGGVLAGSGLDNI